jgi:hypothetical protein
MRWALQLASGLLVFFTAMGAFHLAEAQQAIINLPSADVTPKGQYFVMNESFVRPWDPGTNWKTTNFFTYGLTDKVELAITMFGAGLPKTDNLTLAIGGKAVIPFAQKALPNSELKLTLGYMVPVSLQGRGVGSYGYSHLSGRLPKFKTRLSAGVNAGTDQVFGRDVVCFIGGIEHPLTQELSAIAEYYSGTHDFAGGVLGLVYHNHRWDTVLVGGFRIPNNAASGQSGLVFEVGKFIGPKPHRPHAAHKPTPPFPYHRQVNGLTLLPDGLPSID